jgi:hypothetical protein
MGHQKLLADDLPAAAAHFEAAQHLDPLSIPAALGLAEATILQGKLREAEQQLAVSSVMLTMLAVMIAGCNMQNCKL